MSDAELKSFLEWVAEKQKLHNELSDAAKRTDAFKLNHASRALAFLEIRTELKQRLAAQKANLDILLAGRNGSGL